jgi:hypothetical protein
MTNCPERKSWRDVLPIHPAAELFPLMSQEELRELGEDIKAKGTIHHPIVLYQGKLLDGRNRLDAMEMVGFDFDFERGHAVHHLHRSTDPYEYVISASLHRRHLTAEQKRYLIAKVLKAKPEQSNRKIAKQAKADDKTVANVRRGLEATAEIPKLKKTIGADGKSRPKIKKSSKQSSPAKADPIGGSPARHSKAAPADLVSQAIGLVEKMTANQRQDFVAWLKTKGLIDAFVPHGSAEVSVEQRRTEHAALDEIPDDLSVPTFLRRPSP